MRRLWRTSRADALTLAVTFIATLTIRLEVAILVGVLVSLLVYLNRATHPNVVRVAPDPAQAAALPSNPRRHAAVPAARHAAHRRCALLRVRRAHPRRDRGGARVAPGDAAPAADRHRHQPRSTAPAANCSRTSRRRCAMRGSTLYLCRMRPEVVALLERGGYLDVIGRDRVFATKDQAIAVDLPHARCREMRRVQRAHLRRMPGDAAGRQPAGQAAPGTDADAARELTRDIAPRTGEREPLGDAAPPMYARGQRRTKPIRARRPCCRESCRC